MHWRKVTIVGVGLLGGSLGLAIKQRKLAGTVEGYVRRASSVAECRKAQAVDRATQDLQSAVSGADLVILCTPLARMRPLVKELLPALKRGAVVTDVGSVKSGVVKDLESLVSKAGAHFVGSHPMAGAERMGVSAARADLFECAACVVTPTRKSNPKAVKKLQQFWKAVGGRVFVLSPDTHDALVSRSSHLPHVVAATLAANVLDPKEAVSVADLCATGFRDTTRIASGSPEMWRDIALANRRHLGDALKGYMKELQQFQKLLAKKDEKGIRRLFETAKRRRDDWGAFCASPSPE